MKKIWMLLLLITCSIGFTGQPIYSQLANRTPATPQEIDPFSQYKFKVAVRITCDNDNIKNLIESHIKRELRNLGDVRLTNVEDALHVIQIIAVLNKYELSQQDTGNVSIAYLFLSEDRGLLSTVPIVRTMVREEKLAEFDRLVKIHGKCYSYPYLGVAHYQKDDVNKLCRNIVATFDIESLEPVRKWVEELR